MGNHVSTDAVPFTLEDIVYTQRELQRGTGASVYPNLSPRGIPATHYQHYQQQQHQLHQQHYGAADYNSATAIPPEVTERFDGIDHNIKAFRLYYNRPSQSSSAAMSAAAAAAAASAGAPPSPSSTAGNVHNDPLSLAGSVAGGRRSVGPPSPANGVPAAPAPLSAANADRRSGRNTPRAASLGPGAAVGGVQPPAAFGSSSPSTAAATAAGGSGAIAALAPDAAMSSLVHVDPVPLNSTSLKPRASDVYLVIHIQRVPLTNPTGGSGSGGGTSSWTSGVPSPKSVLEDLGAAAAGHAPPNRQQSEDADRYGPDRAPPWAAQMGDVFTPRGLAASFATDIGRPAIASYAARVAAAAAAAGGGTTPVIASPSSLRTPRSAVAGERAANTPAPPPVPAIAGSCSGGPPPPCEFQYSVHLLTGRRAHPLTAAVAVLHALQLERRFAECPELYRRLFFNCNIARVPMGGNPVSAVVGIERIRVEQMLAVTRAAPIGFVAQDGEAGGSAHASLHASQISLGGSGATARGVITNSSSVSYYYYGGGGGGGSLQDLYPRNALLRLLHTSRLAPVSRASSSQRMSPGSLPNSARFSFASTPRSARPTYAAGGTATGGGATPGGSVVGTGGGGSGASSASGGLSAARPNPYGLSTPLYRKRPVMPVPPPAEEPQLQGPPTLEIPKPRYDAVATTPRSTTGSKPKSDSGATTTTTTGTAAASRPPPRCRDWDDDASDTTLAPTPGAGDSATTAAVRRPSSAAPKPGATTATAASAAAGPQRRTGSRIGPAARRDSGRASASTVPPSSASSSLAVSPAAADLPPAMPELHLGDALKGLRLSNGPQPARPATSTSASASASAAAAAFVGRTQRGDSAHAAVPMLPLTGLPPGSVGSVGAVGDGALAPDRNDGIGADGSPSSSSSSSYPSPYDATNEVDVAEDRIRRLRQAAPEATEVLPCLFVGGETAAKDRAQLLTKGITGVVNTVAFDLPNYHDDVFRYLPLYLCDAPDEPIFSLFPVVIRFIEEEAARGGKVYIHCHQGVSRSCSFVIAYAMWKRGMCYDRAYELVRSRRKVCSPNSGFFVNLRVWEDQLVKPVFNKAYAYLPYTEQYAFPFSFRLALTFRRNANLSYDDDNALIITPFTQFVEDGDTCIVDTRSYYGFLFGERQAPTGSAGGGGGGGAAPRLYSFGYKGHRCDPAISGHAQQEWLSFLRYSFYQGTCTVSTNDKGETLGFTPLSSLDTACFPGGKISPNGDAAVVLSAADTAEVAGRVGSLMFASPEGGGGGAASIVLREEPFEKFDPLFRHDKLLFYFASRLKDDGRLRAAEDSRKRARAVETRGAAAAAARPQRRASSTSPPSFFPTAAAVAAATAAAAAAGTNGSSGSKNGASTATAAPPSAARAGAPSPRAMTQQQQQQTPASRSSVPALGLNLNFSGSGTNANAAGKDASAVGGGPLGGSRSRSSGSSAHAITSLLVFTYPFTEKTALNDGDDDETVLLDDLDPAECYAIIVPDGGAYGNRAYLWMGDDADASEEEVWGAFWARLASEDRGSTGAADGGDGDGNEEERGVPCTVRVPGKAPLRHVRAEVTTAAEEPDHLLLLM